MFLKFVAKNLSIFSLQRRFIETRSLKFKTHGEPTDVLQMVTEELPEPKDFQILVEVLLAPINPSDINIIQGKYPIQQKLPATAGNEFVGQILKMGERVENFNITEHVVAFEHGLGTWSKYLLLEPTQIYAIPFNVPLPEAATLTINPCTAYRMLNDYVKLQPSDCIIQNGASSAVGQAVHQLCKIWGIKSVGVVRDRPEITKLKQYLLSLGATTIFTEEELLKTDVFKTGCLPKPRLALNCVGGESATNIAKVLDFQGVMVTYGGMSKKPVSMATGSFIFKQQTFIGFWLTEWIRKNRTSPEREMMLRDIIRFIERGQFKAPNHTIIPFEQYQEHCDIFKLGDKPNTKFLFKMS